MTPQSYGFIKYEPRKTGNNNLLIEIQLNNLKYSTLKLPSTIGSGNNFHLLML